MKCISCNNVSIHKVMKNYGTYIIYINLTMILKIKYKTMTQKEKLKGKEIRV